MTTEPTTKQTKAGLAVLFTTLAALGGGMAATLVSLPNTDQGQVIEVIENQKCGFLPGDSFKVLHSPPKLTEMSYSSGMTDVVWGPADYEGVYTYDPLSRKMRAVDSDNCVSYDHAVKLDTDGDSVADLLLNARTLLKNRTVIRIHDEFKQRSGTKRLQEGDTIEFSYQEPFIERFFPLQPARPHPTGKPELGRLKQYSDTEGWSTRITDLKVVATPPKPQ